MNDAGLTVMSHLALGQVIRAGSQGVYQEIDTIFDQHPDKF
jgi:hypothetical protein